MFVDDDKDELERKFYIRGPFQAYTYFTQIYLLKTQDEILDSEFYRMRYSSKDKLDGYTAAKFERRMYEADIVHSQTSRGFFIRTCGKDLTNILSFQFYSYKYPLVPQYQH